MNMRDLSLGKTTVLSAVGGLYEASKQAHVYCALRAEDNQFLLYVSAAHTGNIDVANYKSLLNSNNVKFAIVKVPFLADIRAIYGEAATDSATEEDTNNAMRSVAKRWIAQAVEARASDLVLYITNDQTEIVNVVYDRERHVYEDSKQIGEQFVRSVFSSMLSSSKTDYIPTLPADGAINDAKLLPPNLWSIRVNSLPSAPRQKITFRVIYKLPAKSMAELGFTAEQVVLLRRLPFKQGLVLFCGPTGGGKTTSAYYYRQVMREELPGTSLTAIGQPVEIEDPTVASINVSGKDRDELKANYEILMSALLRSAPKNVDMGEIRDGASASAAIQIAQTGHHSIASLHVGNGFAAVKRLRTLAATESAQLASDNLAGIVSQRLVRVLCKECSEPYPLQDWLSRGHSEAWWRQSVMRTSASNSLYCAHCTGLGTSHRRIIAEVIELDTVTPSGETIAELLFSSGDNVEAQARKHWLALGNQSLNQLALAGIQSGELDPDSTIAAVNLKRGAHDQ
jgi:general secretion pathway protein E